jgi:hypothetical protein
MSEITPVDAVSSETSSPADSLSIADAAATLAERRDGVPRVRQVNDPGPAYEPGDREYAKPPRTFGVGVKKNRTGGRSIRRLSKRLSGR